MIKDEELDLALEALENSYDYVAEEADRVERMYGNYPTRQGKVKGLRQDERKHMEAITAIKQARSAPVQTVISAGLITPAMQAGPTTEQKEQMVRAMQSAYPAAPVQEPVEKLQVTLQDRPIDIELAQYKRMFESACSALGAIGDALGCDQEEGGAEPILAAIAELKAIPPAAQRQCEGCDKIAKP